MDWLIRVLCGFHPMMAVEDEGGGEGSVVVDGTDGGADLVVDQPGKEPAGKEPAEAPKPEATENAMLEGIKKALAPADPEATKKAEEAATAAAAQKKADEEFAAANKGKTPEEIAEAKAAREAEAKKKAEAEEAEKAKTRKADDYQLTPQMKKHLSQEAQQRFHHLHRHAKEQEATVAKLSEDNRVLAEARDGILGVLQDTKTTQDQLIGYLNFNSLLHSTNPRDLEAALGMVENQRAALYKALGKEGAGVDLLSEFPDLQQRVAESQITREDALELANGRRQRAQQQAHGHQQSEQARAAQAAQKVQEDAMAGIEKWSRKMAGEDIDYKKKEEKLLEKLPQIIRGYPPNLWLTTFQNVYEAITVVKPPQEVPGGGGTLRPSGAKPGARTFTELTPEALRAGLGYPPSG